MESHSEKIAEYRLVESRRFVVERSRSVEAIILLGRLWRDPFAVASVLVLSLTILVAVLAPVLATFDPVQTDSINRLLPPMAADSQGRFHLLGTDQVGRDVLSRLFHGARVSLMVAVSAVLIAGGIGTVLGMVAGFYGKQVDSLISAWLDLQLSFPTILLAILVAAVFRPSTELVILILGITGWMVFARVARGLTLSLSQQEYVEAARAIGATSPRIIFKHVLPNIVLSISVLATIQLGIMIVLEASLSFLGIGVQPPNPSWGSMLSEGRTYLGVAWWLMAFPGLIITVNVLAVNLLGAWIERYLQPHRKRSET